MSHHLSSHRAGPYCTSPSATAPPRAASSPFPSVSAHRFCCLLFSDCNLPRTPSSHPPPPQFVSECVEAENCCNNSGHLMLSAVKPSSECRCQRVNLLGSDRTATQLWPEHANLLGRRGCDAGSQRGARPHAVVRPEGPLRGMARANGKDHRAHRQHRWGLWYGSGKVAVESAGIAHAPTPNPFAPICQRMSYLVKKSFKRLQNIQNPQTGYLFMFH